jgi:hypothetical protein
MNMQIDDNYRDLEPKLFQKDIALDLIKHAKQYLGRYVLIDNKQYKFAETESSSNREHIDISTKCFLFGTLISNDRHRITLSLDKIIDLYEKQSQYQ